MMVVIRTWKVCHRLQAEAQQRSSTLGAGPLGSHGRMTGTFLCFSMQTPRVSCLHIITSTPFPLLHLPYLYMGMWFPQKSLQRPHRHHTTNPRDSGSAVEMGCAHHLWLVQGGKDHLAEACSSGGRRRFCKSHVG